MNKEKISNKQKTKQDLEYFTRDSQEDELSGAEAFAKIIDLILGKDWHVVDSIGQRQVNYIAYKEIESKIKSKESTYIIYTVFLCLASFLIGAIFL